MRGLSKDRCFILLFAVFWCLAQDAVISSQFCISWPMLVFLVEVSWNVACTSVLLNRNIRLVLQLQRTDGCLISEPLSNSFHTAAVHLSCPGVAFNTAEVSVLAGTVKTFADEFFGMESSKPALLSFQYQIQQTVCFCHNSLSDHFIFHFPDLPISSSSYSTPTVDAHSPTALAVQKLFQKRIPLVWIPAKCKGHYNSHT